MSTLNFNVGVLGHVDSGKTSLAKALSTVASTACFDKNPQSRERGITLDLGFSSFTVQSSDSIKQKGFEYVQYTLVDCPGHASLIKTIIGGAQIIDMMMLVVDITKGIQTQTAECLIIGEICCDKMLIVLNKLDLVEQSKRAATIEKISKRLLKTLEPTKFANSKIIAVSANQQQQTSLEKAECKKELLESVESLSLEKKNDGSNINIDILIDTLRESTFLPDRKNKEGLLLFSVDHCFGIKGQGTVLTGTILSGHVKINDNIEIPSLKVQTKVKSIQVFRKPVDKAFQGDRCGICISNFDSKQFERGVVSSPNYVRTCYGVIINLEKVKYFKGTISSGSKFHISIGHETLLGKIIVFAEPDGKTSISSKNEFDFNREYIYLDEFNSDVDNHKKDNDQENIQEEDTLKSDTEKHGQVYAFVDFNYEANTNSQSVLCVNDSLVIGSKLDADIHLNQCRIAFYGRVLYSFVNKDFKEIQNLQVGAASKTSQSISSGTHLASIKVYKNKCKTGVVERRHDETTVIGKSLFKKETNIDLFVGMKVNLSTGDNGYIEAGFGQSGKFKVRIPVGLSPALREQLDAVKPKKKAPQEDAVDSQGEKSAPGSIKIFLNFKRFIFDEKRKMIQ